MIGYKSVTNRTQDDLNTPKTNLTLDPVTGSSRNTTQEYLIPMPSNSESYRARMKTLGVGYVFGRLKHPMEIQLRTANVEVMVQCQEWFFGENCWGMAQLDQNEKPIGTPSMSHVLHYDHMIQRKMADLMNEGHDFLTALNAAKADGEIRAVHFISPVSRDINTPECRACSAPGLREAYGGTSSSASRAIMPPGNFDPKKIRAEIRAEEVAKLKRQKRGRLENGQESKRAKKKANANRNALALANGGVGDGSGGAPPQPNYPRKGDGKGDKGKKGKGKGNNNMPDGRPICFNWNKGTPCKSSSCTMAHARLICHGDHRQKDHV